MRPETTREQPDRAGAVPPASFMTRLPVPASVTVANPKRANLIVSGIVLTVMAVMAATGLGFAMKTVSVRRAHDTVLPPRSRKPFERFLKKPPEPVEPAETVAPVHLAGLGYLPAGVNLVAGVHVEELLLSPAGKDVMSNGIKIGPVDLKLEAVTERFGIAAEEIDHLVLGVQMGDGKEVQLTPPLTVVVRTRRPYDAKKVRTALKAGRPRKISAPGGETRWVYSIMVQNFPLLLWLADEQTVVLRMFGKMEDVPIKPLEGAVSLSEELRNVLEQRIGTGVPLWVAGHSRTGRRPCFRFY